jgi:hypothetical protein
MRPPKGTVDEHLRAAAAGADDAEVANHRLHTGAWPRSACWADASAKQYQPTDGGDAHARGCRQHGRQARRRSDQQQRYPTDQRKHCATGDQPTRTQVRLSQQQHQRHCQRGKAKSNHCMDATLALAS